METLLSLQPNKKEPFNAFICGVHSITVKPVLKDHIIGYNNVVYQDRRSLVTGLVIGPSARNVWSFKIDGLSWQWSLKRSLLNSSPGHFTLKEVQFRNDFVAISIYLKLFSRSEIFSNLVATNNNLLVSSKRQ